MKLKKILNKFPLKVFRGNKDTEILGLCSHSKRVAPGDLFIAKKGMSDDGHKYIHEAVASGAMGILSDMPDPFLKKDLIQLTYPSISEIEGNLASFFYEEPSQNLFTVGITGTNGKTTTSYILRHLLERQQVQTGLIGSIEYVIGSYHLPSELATPEVVTLHKLLKEMVCQKCKAAVMEVTSLGIHQNRIAGVDFDCAIFTNLTQDHLDYHKTIEEYARVKASLFSRLSSDKKAIINDESPWKDLMISQCKAEIIHYGFSPTCHLYAHTICLAAEQTTFLLTYQNQTLPFTTSLIGKHNVLNCLAAIGAAIAYGLPFESLPEAIQSFKRVPGRLDRVGSSNVFIDYAHTPDALENVLLFLKEIKPRKIITVFGCGGDRDKGKRPLMAEIAEKYSDKVIVTTDNPRSEDPVVICEEIQRGFKNKNHIIQLDRKEAIRLAISSAENQDLILIAGKGHETYQVFSHQTIEFDDRLVAAECLKTLNYK